MPESRHKPPNEDPRTLPSGSAARDGQLTPDPAEIPWADLVPDAVLVRWLESHPCPQYGARALVDGCGLGDNAEELARCGMEVTALDDSPVAVRWCLERFPDTPVDYRVGTAAALPSEYDGQFHLVLASCTLAHTPAEDRADALRRIATLVAPGGTLLLVERPHGGIPVEPDARAAYRAAVAAWLAGSGLEPVAMQDETAQGEGTAAEYCVAYVRPA